MNGSDFMRTLKDIKSRNELADFLGVSRSLLTYVLYVKKTNNFYSHFEIMKKSGEPRQINAPMGELKDIQKKLADVLYKHQAEVRITNGIKAIASHGFEKKKGIITNAAVHKNRKIVINIDLEDFFDSFHFGRVVGYFEKNRNFKLPHEVAIVIAQLACYEGRLPQGAPSSPIITNLICETLDIHLLRLAKKYRLNYSRYADDLTFSTNDKNILLKQTEFFEELEKLIEHSGFKINIDKTRIQFKDSRQTVTGLVVNKKVSVEREYYKRLRAMAHELYTTGSYYIDGEAGTLNQLEGMFSFVNMIDTYNNQSGKKRDRWTLNSREKQYQKFLFYKYFFANETTLIVTEGKTDIVYIKAALKNLYEYYPTLIEKKKDGSFTFKVSFLNRTKRLGYFFGLGEHGADAMCNLYDYLVDTGKKNFPNYSKMLQKLSKRQQKTKIVFILDNEQSNNDKPLAKFLKNIKATGDQKLELKQNLKLQLGEMLFVITNPLVNGKTECEIETLFDEATLSYKYKGKTLSLTDKYDSNKHYGKNTFSKYINANYQKIDFNNFKPMLDKIKDIVAIGDISEKK